MIHKTPKHCTIYLMRHGQAAPNGILAGQTDYPLTQKGETEIQAWASFFAPIPISAVWSSPLLRARQSAEIIMKSLNKPISEENFFIEPNFREISLGKWEGLSKDEVRQNYAEEWEQRGRDFMHFAPPEGESFDTLAKRAVPAFKRLFRDLLERRHVLIMAHQAVNRSILAEFGEHFKDSWREIPQDCAGLNELDLSKKRSGAFHCNIIRVNARAPLWIR